MNNKFICGLEIHVQLNTRTKLFSKSKNNTNDIENVNVSLFDIGMVGTYPILNLCAVYKAIKACYLMQSNISEYVTFDRKHYRYLDLPLSYQITQFHNPIGVGGIYKISEDKIISIKDIHIECDAAKIKEYDNKIVIDYNRCCAPLIEIVTKPCFSAIEEIELFLSLLIQDLRQNNISDARFEMSQIRVDVNISREINNTYSNRLEIKNLNSFRSIKKSILLAKNMLVNDKINEDYTLHYDDVHQTVSIARKKEKALDYMYYHDSSIPKLITKNIINKVDKNVCRTIDLVHKINKITNGLLCNGKIKTIINSDEIRCTIDRYIKSYSESNYVHPIDLILEIQDIIVENNYYDKLDMIVFLIKLCVDKKILKLNLKSILNLVIDELNNISELNNYLKSNNLIIDNNLEVTDKEVIDLINSVDSTLIDRAKIDKKVMSYTIGLVLSKYKNCSPKYICNIVQNILNKN